ncbi:MAG: MaoC family dehydratase [Candidatus Competibacteraceae bacterium]|nr:MaoC family dehydratase [Candidatus Competibacteraceae bacterium]
MSSFRQKAVAGLRAGDIFSISRTFTEQDVTRFAAISRDYNPVHFDDRFARAKSFSGPICHGLLVASMLTEIGGQIGWLASGMNFRFRRPVPIGETITCEFTITEIDPRGRARAEVSFTDSRGTVVLECTLIGMVPGGAERQIMQEMLEEGDPTNPLVR